MTLTMNGTLYSGKAAADAGFPEGAGVGSDRRQRAACVLLAAALSVPYLLCVRKRMSLVSSPMSRPSRRMLSFGACTWVGQTDSQAELWPAASPSAQGDWGHFRP